MARSSPYVVTALKLPMGRTLDVMVHALTGRPLLGGLSAYPVERASSTLTASSRENNHRCAGSDSRSSANQ